MSSHNLNPIFSKKYMKKCVVVCVCVCMCMHAHVSRYFQMRGDEAGHTIQAVGLPPCLTQGR